MLFSMSCNSANDSNENILVFLLIACMQQKLYLACVQVLWWLLVLMRINKIN